MKTILVTCGETSGDHHAGLLVREILRRDPSCRVIALGGPELAAAGAEIRYPLERYAVMGFAEIVRHLPALASLEYSITRLLACGGVDLFIPVDYPGLNLRLAGRARGAGVPVMYFISPQVWAWGGWRMRGMRRSIDLMAAILPFEEEIYREAGIPAIFAGHPMLDEIPAPPAPKESPLSGASSMATGATSRTAADAEALFTVLLFPGSRAQEFRRMFPVLRDAARLLHGRFPGARFELGLAPLIPLGMAAVPPDMKEYLKTVPDGIARLGGASLVLAVSGTVTLQTALSGTPMVVGYRTSAVTYRIGRSLVKIPWIAMPNVLAGRGVVPELIQGDATPERFAEAAARLLEDPARFRSVSLDLVGLRERLRGKGGLPRVAEAALRMAAGESGEAVARS